MQRCTPAAAIHCPRVCTGRLAAPSNFDQRAAPWRWQLLNPHTPFFLGYSAPVPPASTGAVCSAAPWWYIFLGFVALISPRIPPHYHLCVIFLQRSGFPPPICLDQRGMQRCTPAALLHVAPMVAGSMLLPPTRIFSSAARDTVRSLSLRQASVRFAPGSALRFLLPTTPTLDLYEHSYMPPHALHSTLFPTIPVILSQHTF